MNMDISINAQRLLDKVCAFDKEDSYLCWLFTDSTGAMVGPADTARSNLLRYFGTAPEYAACDGAELESVRRTAWALHIRMLHPNGLWGGNLKWKDAEPIYTPPALQGRVPISLKKE